MAANLRSRSTDGRVIRVETSQHLLLDVAGEKRSLQPVKFLGNVVLPVEVVLTKHLGEDLLGQNVLDEHLANIHIGQGD